MNQLLMGLLLLVSSHCFAGPRIVGNGGVGVELNGHLYMLDLYERGIQEKAYYAPDVKTFAWVETELAQAFSMVDLPQVPMQKLIRKVNEVMQKRYYQGIALHEALKRIDWRLVNEELVRLDDVKTPMDGLPLRQIAIRQENVVFINSRLWNQLDEDNKVALLIHEAFYFFAEPLKFQNSIETYYEQSAAKTRSITGLVFTKRFAVEGFTKSNTTYEIVYLNDPGFYRVSRELTLLAVRGLIRSYATSAIIDREISFSVSEYKTPESLKAAAEQAIASNCTEFLLATKGKKIAKVPMEFYLGTVASNSKVYSSTYQTRTGEMQTSLKISYGDGSLMNEAKILKIDLDVSSQRKCVQTLSSELVRYVNSFNRYND